MSGITKPIMDYLKEIHYKANKNDTQAIIEEWVLYGIMDSIDKEHEKLRQYVTNLLEVSHDFDCWKCMYNETCEGSPRAEGCKLIKQALELGIKINFN